MKKPFRRYGVVSLGLRIATVALAVAAGMGTGGFAQAGEGKSMPVIVDKTLVAWVRLADTAQRGGSALTLDDMGTRFDGIVFGEIAPGKWMAGSDGFQRTSKHQDADPAEMAGPETAVQIAIVYEGHKVSVFRNGEPYAHHIIGSAQTFGPGSVAVMGLRHLVSTDRACLAGAIEDARIFAARLTVEQIAALRPHEASE
ncbi:MAG: beta-fructofuranosidase, partial [Candidatus Hydrogenedentes bacterium]|nr:beta-fructofuranosidase [Candidatus Hydrogenedentota bacterium]